MQEFRLHEILLTCQPKGYRMPQRAQGFTVIELVIVVTIVAILAAMVVSAFQTYTVRTQVEEALDIAENAKVSIRASYDATGVAPANRESAGLSSQFTKTTNLYVAEVTVKYGRLDIRFGRNAHQAIFGGQLSLTPYVMADGQLAWRCGVALAPPLGELLPEGAEHAAPSIEERYLPPSCRP